MTFGDKVALIRGMLRLTQAQVWEMAQVSKMTLHRVEHNESPAFPPFTRAADRIAVALTGRTAARVNRVGKNTCIKWAIETHMTGATRAHITKGAR